MSDLDLELRRFEALSDRDAVGEPLSHQERAFVERMVREHPECRLEAALLEELADLDAPVGHVDQTRALVDAALAQLSSPAQGALHDSSRERDARARARRQALGWTTGAVAIAAAAALFLSIRTTPQHTGAAVEPSARIELVYLSGDVLVDGHDAVNGSRLLGEGSVLSVRSGGACIAMDPQIDVCAAAGTKLKLTHTSSAARRLDLLEGKIAVQLATQPEGGRLSIVSDGVWSTAIGTAFTVQRNAELGVQTTVLHGKVRVGKIGAREQIVAAHQRARVKRDVPEVTAVGRGEESPDWALLAPTKLWGAPVAATLELTGLPTGAEALLDGERIGIAPISTLVPVGEHRLDVRLENAVVWSKELSLSAGERAAISLAGVDLRAPAVTEQAPAVIPVPELGVSSSRARTRALYFSRARTRALYEPRVERKRELGADSAVSMLSEARRLLRQGALAEAAAQYTALLEAHPRSAESRIGLLSLAELQLEHLRQPGAALQNAERYLADGGGSLSPEAEETRVRALRSLGRTNEEHDAIEAFLGAHPDSLRSSTLRRRLDELNAASSPLSPAKNSKAEAR